MKLISSTQLIESKVENIFTKKYPYEVSTLTTSQELSTVDVTDRMMKEVKDVEDSAALPGSDCPNGQIETLNGTSPKSSQKILDVNKSSLSFDVTVKKVTIPPQWGKLNSSSSSESLPLNEEVASNGIPVDSTYDNESDILLSEEEMDRNSLGFDFVDDSEKFGLSDSEVDKLLKDVDEKDKPDVPKSTKTDNKEEEKDSNTETFTAAVGGTSEKSGNLAHMLLSNFEKQLQSGFEISINSNISNKSELNHVSEKEIKIRDPKVISKNDKPRENTIINTTKNDTDQFVDNHKDVELKNVAESSLVTEKIIENNVDIDNRLKLDSLDSGNSNVSSQSNISESYCLSKSNDSQGDGSSSGLLGSNAKMHDLQDKDSFNKTGDLFANNILSNDSQDESSNKTDLLEYNSDSSKVDSSSKKENAPLETIKNADENIIDDQLTATEIKNSEAINNGGNLESGMEISEADVEMQDDSLEPNEISSAGKFQDDSLEPNKISSAKKLQDDSLELNEILSAGKFQNDSLEPNEISSVRKLQDDSLEPNEISSAEKLQDDLLEPNEISSARKSQDDSLEPNEISSTGKLQDNSQESNEILSAGKLQDDSLEPNKISSAVELQDIAPSSEKSIDATAGNDMDLDEIQNDKEIPDYSRSLESVMHNEVAENSMDSQIQGELESNIDDFENECVNENDNARDIDEGYEQISDSEFTTDAQIGEKENSELKMLSTNEKQLNEETAVNSIGNENSMVEPEHDEDNNEVERLMRKRASSLEGNAERGVKRTKVTDSDNKSSDSNGKCIEENDSEPETGRSKELDNSHQDEKEDDDKDSSSKVDEVNNVDEVSDSVKGNEENDKTKYESEKSKSDSVSDENKNKGDEERCSEVPDKESEIVRTGTKRAHEQVGLIEVKKVRITPEMENQLSKLGNSEKLQKSSTGSTAKVLLVDKNASQSTNDQNGQDKQIDNESVSLVESEHEEFRNSNKDTTKSKESLLTDKEESTKGVSEEKQTEDRDTTDDDLVENKSKSDNLENEKSNETKKKNVDKTVEPTEPKNSLPPRSPKSNLEFAIERVVLGITDEPEEITEAEKSKEPKKLNPMPFMRNLQDNLLKKLSRSDLEEMLVQKLCEVVTDRCTIGDMRQRCQTLEQMLEQWRKKVQQLQKQLKDMEMVMKRYIGDARTRKERPIPVKITRSVGLQVHMGPMNAGMLRNRPLCNDPARNQGQVRRRANRVSSPPVTGTTQQNQQQSTQPQPQQQSQQQPQQQTSSQQSQRQTPQIVGGTAVAPTPLTVQKVVTPGFSKLTTTSSPQAIAPRPSIAVAPQIANKVTKIASTPVKPVARPVTSIAAVISTGSATSTINTMNNTIVNTASNLRVASAAQLNNRQPVKQTANKSGDLKIIDLTDEEDRSKTNNLRGVNPAVSTVAASMISSAVTTGVPITTGTSIQAGSIRVVQPHQLTGTTTTTLLAPSTPTSANSRLAYFVPTSGGSVQQRQVLIASSGAQVRPGVMNVQNRQNQLPTLVFKNGTVVPIQQASGTQPVNTAILRPGHPMPAGQLQQVLPTRPGQPIRVAPSLVTTVGRMTTPAITNVPVLASSKHPAPLPNPPVYQPSNPNWKFSPPKPELKISKGANKHQQGIVLSWNMTLTSDFEEIASYQLYAYQEGSAQPSTTLWKKVGDVKALPLPMACTLTQFMEGHKYHFAVRAVDVHMRVGPFSTPGNIVLTRK